MYDSHAREAAKVLNDFRPKLPRELVYQEKSICPVRGERKEQKKKDGLSGNQRQAKEGVGEGKADAFLTSRVANLLFIYT